MSEKSALQSFTGEYYSNILLTDPQSRPLTTISARRAQWYLDRNLAVSLGPQLGYTNCVQLTFEPKSRNSNEFLKAILPTQCVVCGAKEKLTLHHVIPMAVKRFFPQEEKDHTRQWCVLVCEQHHLEAEKQCRPFYEQSLQEAVKAVQAQESERNKLYYKLVNMLYGQNMFIEKVRGVLKDDELELIGDTLTALKTSEDEIENVKKLIVHHKQTVKAKVKEAKAVWGKAHIEALGGIGKVKEIYRDCFLALKPQCLPEGFLVDIEMLDAE